MTRAFLTFVALNLIGHATFAWWQLLTRDDQLKQCHERLMKAEHR